jgi:formate hydrogenlyase transcriptional activator
MNTCSRKPAILAIDDNPINLEELTFVLSEAGFDVTCAEDGERAVARAATSRPDLILLDIMLPDIDGFALCRHFKQDAHTAQTPILFMTSLDDVANKVKGFTLGAVDYITKPFQHDELLARVNTHWALEKLRLDLQEKEERLARIFEHAMDAIVTTDHEGTVTLFNNAAEKMFKCDVAAAIGTPFTRFLSTGLSRALSDYQARDEGSFVVRRASWLPEGLNAIRADGEEFPVEATVSRIDAAKQIIFTVILRDINERKARQRAEAERDQLRGLNTYLEEEVRAAHNVGDLIGVSPTFLASLALVRQVAGADASVLVTGETGTGKELIARAIHSLSPRREKPLVRLNCAAIPATLAESELFGHEKGAFTGALARKLGRFELAHRGTLFLDEIGELPVDLQAKLLRVLQEGEFERVGGTQTIRCDVRLIAATNRDLPRLVAEGRFRSDLYYRLNVFPIDLPALRERREDIPLLTRHFVQIYCKKIGKTVESVPQRMLSALQQYGWPGNIRELQNVMERAVILSTGTQLAEVEWGDAARNSDTKSAVTLEEIERQHIIKVLETTDWRIAGQGGAATILGLPSTTLRSRMEKLGIRKNSSHR